MRDMDGKPDATVNHYRPVRYPHHDLGKTFTVTMDQSVRANWRHSYRSRRGASQMPDADYLVPIHNHGLSEPVGSERSAHFFNCLGTPLPSIFRIVARPIDRPPNHVKIVHPSPAETGFRDLSEGALGAGLSNRALDYLYAISMHLYSGYRNSQSRRARQYNTAMADSKSKLAKVGEELAKHTAWDLTGSPILDTVAERWKSAARSGVSALASAIIGKLTGVNWWWACAIGLLTFGLVWFAWDCYRWRRVCAQHFVTPPQPDGPAVNNPFMAHITALARVCTASGSLWK
jgi:hypothetical protein